MKSISLSKLVAVSLGALIVMLAVVFTLRAQTPSLNLKGGSKLVYTMQTTNASEDAQVILNTLTPTLSFKWKTPENQFGKVVMSTEEFASGRKLSSKLMEDLTNSYGFFWMSKGMYSELAQGKTQYFLNGSDKMSAVTRAGVEDMQVKVNGTMKTIQVLHAKSIIAGGDEFFVLNDATNPLIIKMTTVQGSFTLKEITE